VTYAAAIGIGVIETLIEWNYPGEGLVQILLLAAVLGSLLFRSGLSESLRGAQTGWTLGGAIRALPPGLAILPVVRWGRWIVIGASVLVAVLATTVMSNAQLSLFSSVVIFAIMGLSLVVLTGFAGQVSLGQAAFVALGGFGAGKAYALGFPTLSVAVYAVAICVVAAVIVGLPAIRVRGLFLSVSTLTFAVFAQGWLFGQDFLMKAFGASSQHLPRGSILGFGIDSEKRYAWLTLACFAAIAGLVHRVRATGVGRSMIAVRDNEPAAMTFSLSPNKVKLTAFGLSGGIAGFAGWLYGGVLVNYSDISLTAPSASLELVVMTVLGGVGSVTGALLGALWVKGIPYFFGETWGIFSSAFGVLMVLLFLRGGLGSIDFSIRDRLISTLTGQKLDEVRASQRQDGITRQPLPPSPLLQRSDEVVLEARNVTVSYGGNVAVSDVSMQLHRGELLGILGPNGAGKTTFFDVLTGQITPDEGQIILHGMDVTRLRPEQRAELLLGRTFQQARLFDELKLFESLQVALERGAPTELVPSLLGLPPSRRAERAKRLRAAELIDLLGLEPFAHRPMTALSTGTRRMAELAAVVAMGARVVLLDEPTAGVAQAEVEQFTPVIREIADHLGASLIVIEHDIPLMMSMVDRLCVLAAGKLIADGPPQSVGNDPAVIAAYLGTDERVVQRSGQRSAGTSPTASATAHQPGTSASHEEIRQ
ncbi:MAG: hypothetical protein QOE58_1673, partial [Actinomycetota bacterium]|nr:hypothetical protein [Actinomycetota bacterium]